MTKEQQDIAWACLPKEAREEIRDIVKTSGMGIHGMFDLVFGGNVTLDTEPEEMLCISRREIICKANAYMTWTGRGNYEAAYIRGKFDLLDELFGDKRLPDKDLIEDNFAKSEPSVQAEPKFKVGDKVYQTSGHDRLEEFTIKKVYKDKRRGIVYDIQGLITILGVEENNLCWSHQNPYTEPETKDNKEKKELNLCELLKGCEGRRFWSDTYGYVTLFHVDRDFLIFLTKIESLSLLVEPDGTSAHTGKIVVFPSRSKRNWDEYGVSEFLRKES